MWQRILRAGLVVAAVILGVALGRVTGRPCRAGPFFALGTTQPAVALRSGPARQPRQPMLPAAVATTLAGRFAGLYLPFLQELLPTEPVTGIDLLGVFLASTLGYAAARLDRGLFRRRQAAVLPGTAPGTGS